MRTATACMNYEFVSLFMISQQSITDQQPSLPIRTTQYIYMPYLCYVTYVYIEPIM